MYAVTHGKRHLNLYEDMAALGLRNDDLFHSEDVGDKNDS
jgi:hypothetical protein